MLSKIDALSDSDFIGLVKSCSSKIEILRKLGYLSGATSYPKLNARLAKLNLLEYKEE